MKGIHSCMYMHLWQSNDNQSTWPGSSWIVKKYVVTVCIICQILSRDKSWVINCKTHNLGSFCPYQDAFNVGYWDNYYVMATEWKLLSDDYQATSGDAVWSTDCMSL